MNIFKRICLCLIVLVGCIGCAKKNTLDFWTVTYDQLEKYIDTSGRVGKDWFIGLQGKDIAVSKETPNLTVHKYGDRQECVLSFQMSAQSQPYVVYRYVIEEEISEFRTKEKSLELTSTDSQFKNYEMKYSETIFENSNFVSQDSASGTLQIQEDDTIQYDSIPLLKEAIDHLKDMISSMEDTFDIDYAKTSFVNLPAIAQNTDISDVEKISQETADAITYYSKPDINAKGFSLVTCLEISKENPSSAEFAQFNVERQSYDVSYAITLQPQEEENCYMLEFPFDSDYSYIAYIDDINVYLYDTNFTFEQMVDDVKSGGSQASILLSVNNESYKQE